MSAPPSFETPHLPADLFGGDGPLEWQASPDDEVEARALVALSLVPGVGPGRVRALLARFGSAEVARRAPRVALASVPGVGPQTAEAIVAFRSDDAVDAQFAAARKVGARLVTLLDDEYPALLKEIYDPPAFLWVRGRLEPSDGQALALVGTRRASEYGKRVAHEMAAALAGEGLTVVSGLAYGIDAAAHRGALEGGGRTLAVLGSGVDRIYPAEHARLAQEVMAHGAVLSEYPMGATPDGPNFPRRNRIISGLSLGVLVVEAREAGGALITARLAVEQDREVFAIPSSIYSTSGAGCNRLIQRGHAKLVLTIDDILQELRLERTTPAPGAEGAPAPLPALGEIERTLYQALGPEPRHIDTLCADTGIDPSTALVYLLSLEFKGLIRQMAGKQFVVA